MAYCQDTGEPKKYPALRNLEFSVDDTSSVAKGLRLTAEIYFPHNNYRKYQSRGITAVAEININGERLGNFGISKRIYVSEPVISIDFLFPFGTFPIPEGTYNVTFDLSISAGPQKTQWDSKDTEPREFLMPPKEWIVLNFGEFDVDSLDWKGRRWDYRYYFGKGIPEFFWHLEYGGNVVYETEYINAMSYTRLDRRIIPLSKGDELSLSVREYDDLRSEFVGKYMFYPGRETNSFEANMDFDKVKNAHLSYEFIDQPFEFRIVAPSNISSMVDEDDLISDLEFHLLPRGDYYPLRHEVYFYLYQNEKMINRAQINYEEDGEINSDWDHRIRYGDDPLKLQILVPDHIDSNSDYSLVARYRIYDHENLLAFKEYKYQIDLAPSFRLPISVYVLSITISILYWLLERLKKRGAS